MIITTNGYLKNKMKMYNFVLVFIKNNPNILPKDISEKIGINHYSVSFN